MNNKYIYKHGLSVMRAQPFHIGHDRVIKKMLEECEKVTVVLYAVPECEEKRNPLTYSTRKKMIQNVYKKDKNFHRLEVVGLFNKYNPRTWADVDAAEDIFANLPEGDMYYVGNEHDADKFRQYVKNVRIVSRASVDFPFVTASMVRDMLKFGDTRWKNFIHAENYELIENSIFLKK